MLHRRPIALAMGAVRLAAFLWLLESGQYEDLDGAAARILSNQDDKPIVRKPNSSPEIGDEFVKKWRGGTIELKQTETGR